MVFAITLFYENAKGFSSGALENLDFDVPICLWELLLAVFEHFY